MSPDRIKELVSQKPFRPLTIRMSGGESIRVRSPEFYWLLPGGRTMMVVTGKHPSGDDKMEMLDTFLISSIAIGSVSEEKSGRRKRSA